MKTGMRLGALALLATLGTTAPASAASVTISPLAGTPTALPGTQISFLGASAKALGGISLVGSASGRHSGRLRSYSSATGASFLPSKPFTPGERVTVRAVWTNSPKSRRTLTDSFTIAQPAEASKAELPDTPGTAADVQSFQSEPALNPPLVTIGHAAAAGAAPGYVFAAPYLGPGQHGPMIFDNSGGLVWFDPLPGGEDAAAFQTQNFHGKNMLTWWQGHTLAGGYGLGEDVIANANYKTVAIVKAGNGLQADGHEFTVTPEGSAYITAYSPVQASAASASTPASGAGGLDGVIQRIDVHTGLVMWEWHSLGSVAFAQPNVQPPPDLTVAESPFVQTLAGGGTMTAGGGSPSFTEADAHGASVFAGALPAGERSYRVYREPWAGQPSVPPAISARTSGAATAVYASWNGATTVTAWQLLTGSSASRMTPVSTTPKTGFETTIPAPAATFVQVRALSASGKPLASSKTVRAAGGSA
jgi:Arylsulfotransferase (ASST)